MRRIAGICLLLGLTACANESAALRRTVASIGEPTALLEPTPGVTISDIRMSRPVGPIAPTFHVEDLRNRAVLTDRGALDLQFQMDGWERGAISGLVPSTRSYRPPEPPDPDAPRLDRYRLIRSVVLGWDEHHDRIGLWASTTGGESRLVLYALDDRSPPLVVATVSRRFTGIASVPSIHGASTKVSLVTDNPVGGPPMVFLDFSLWPGE